MAHDRDFRRLKTLLALTVAIALVGVVTWVALLPKPSVPQVEGRLWLMRRDGTNASALSSPYVNSPPAFGPGGLVYFSRYTGQTTNLTVADPVAGTVRDLGIQGHSPAPARDGVRLGYLDYGQVKLLFLNNGTRITLFRASDWPSCIDVDNLAFSPNGSLLAWVCSTTVADGGFDILQIVIYDFSSGTIRAVGTEPDFVFLDDEKVVVQNGQTAQADLAVKRIATWQTERTLPGSCIEPAADPDGRAVVCADHSARYTALYSVDIETSTRTFLYSDPGWILRWPAISLDGQWVVFVR